MASVLRKGESALREIVHPKKSKDNLTVSGSSSPGTRSPPPEETAGRMSSELPYSPLPTSTTGSKRGFFGFGKKKEKKEKDVRSIGDASGTISPPESPPKSSATSPNINPTTAILSDAQIPATSISNEPRVAKEALATPAPITVPSITTTSVVKPLSPPLSHPSSPTSPIKTISPPSPPLNSKPLPAVPSSPPHMTSARAAKSGSAQIFERNVQESHPISSNSSTSSTSGVGRKIPAHIATENYIPPVLEASSIAITDKNIDPDNVEVVMHSQHQPLCHQVGHHHGRSIQGDAADSELSSANTSPLRTTLEAPGGSTAYSADKRRLSFISFSDIVQAEQADLLDSTILSPSPKEAIVSGAPATTIMDQVGIQGITETMVRRSPSPAGRRLASSPSRSTTGFLPERDNDGLVVETMGQALRKTGSGDLGKGVPSGL